MNHPPKIEGEQFTPTEQARGVGSHVSPGGKVRKKGGPFSRSAAGAIARGGRNLRKKKDTEIDKFFSMSKGKKGGNARRGDAFLSAEEGGKRRRGRRERKSSPLPAKWGRGEKVLSCRRGKTAREKKKGKKGERRTGIKPAQERRGASGGIGYKENLEKKGKEKKEASPIFLPKRERERRKADIRTRSAITTSRIKGRGGGASQKREERLINLTKR